jgi:hypothetical protein
MGRLFHAKSPRSPVPWIGREKDCPTGQSEAGVRVNSLVRRRGPVIFDPPGSPTVPLAPLQAGDVIPGPSRRQLKAGDTVELVTDVGSCATRW